MNTAKKEAIANADAQANNVGLPTYSELINALREGRDLLAYGGDSGMVLVMRELDKLLACIHI